MGILHFIGEQRDKLEKKKMETMNNEIEELKLRKEKAEKEKGFIQLRAEVEKIEKENRAQNKTLIKDLFNGLEQFKPKGLNYEKKDSDLVKPKKKNILEEF